MNTFKLIAVLLILIVGVSFLFPDKSAEFRNKVYDSAMSIFGIASSTISQTSDFASSTLTERLTNLPGTSEIQDKIIEEAKKVIFTTPLRATKDQAPVLDVILTEAGVISWTNQARIKNNMVDLQVNVKLNEGAEKKVQDMFARQYFDHISPDGAGPAEVAKTSGYEYILIGENLALGNFKNDQELLTAWMDSPGHRANILNSRFTEIGVAIQKGYYEGKEIWMAVQEFGLPLSSCPAPSEDLKKQINSNQNYLDDLLAELQRRKDEIESIQRGSSDYGDKSKAYNERVAAYNKLLEETRVIIEKYNNEVKTFNVCLQG